MRSYTSSRKDQSAEIEQNTISSASSAAEFIHTSGGFSDGPSAKPWGAAPGMHRRASVLKRWWLISLSAIVVLLMASICHQKLGASSLEGVQVRRLAEGEEEEHDGLPRSSSLDFVEFCYSLGTWTPQASVPGEPRASPSLVEAVLAGLEAEAESGEGATTSSGPAATSQGMEALVSGTVLRPVIYEGSPDVEGIWASSWKVGSGENPPSVGGAQGTTSSSVHVSVGDEQSQISQAASLQPSSAFTPVHPPYTFIPVAPQPTTSFSSVPVLEERASTSSSGAARPEAASSVLESDPPRKHPFVRLPKLQPGVEPRQFSPWVLQFGSIAAESHHRALVSMRELFLKPELDAADAAKLLLIAEHLAVHACAKMTSDVSLLTPTEAVDPLSRRFLVLWSLHAASQVLKQDWTKQSWWRELVDKIPSHYSRGVPRARRSVKWVCQLIADLCEAINKLKAGDSLPESVVIDLKRRIFCSPHSPRGLRYLAWDLWRRDDREFLEDS